MLGKILGGRYQIVHHLGGGGFGQTYLAEDLHLPGQPTCVVKQLKPRMTQPEALQTARRLFDTEAQVLYSLGNHDQIPRLFAHFDEDQDFFLVQEFVAGEVLSKEFKTRRQYPEAEVLVLLEEILTVLDFVHQQQVVHRDIKPSNLIRRSSDRRIILIDFGAVKRIGMEATDLGEQATVTIAVGSSGYIPNEQLAGKPRFSSDVYAVGMVAIQCLTGLRPRDLKEDPATSEILWREEVRVSPELVAILEKMVRYDYRQRYPSAKEALADLKQLTYTPSVSALLTQPNLVSFDGHLAWLERGDELFQLQRYKEAICSYDRVIQAKPDDYLAWFKRGIALENIHQFAEAAESFAQVVDLQPNDYLAWFKLGGALEYLQRHPEALEAYRQVIELQPDNYWAWHDRGKVLEVSGHMDEAIASYDRAVQLKPDFQLAIDSRKRVLSQLKRVDALYHLQHYDEALASCDRSIQENPHDPLPWLMRGMALENQNCLEQAVVAYERVVALQPDDHVAWFKRATVLEKLERYPEAVESYAKVVLFQPENVWAWYDRGRLLERLGCAEEAIASYDRVVQLKPDFHLASEGKKRVLGQLQTGKVALSAAPLEEETIVTIKDIDDATSQLSHHRLHAWLEAGNPVEQSDTVFTKAESTFIHPVDPAEETTTYSVSVASATTQPPTVPPQSTAPASIDLSTAAFDDQFIQWLNRGRGLERLRRYGEALAAYDQANQINPHSDDLWRRRGTVLYLLERYEAAIESFQQAVQLQPANGDAWGGMGSAQVKLKQYHEALTSFQQATRLQPQNPALWYWQARVLCELKQFSEALPYFDRAIELKADFAPAIRGRQQVQTHLRMATPCP